MRKITILLFVLLFGLFAFQSCAFFGFEDDSGTMYKSAGQLVEEGAYAYEGKKYKKSLKAYTLLKEWYPFSRWAILAELRIADSNFYLEQYDEALAAYQEFEELHPKNEAIVRIIYRQGLCWYNQIDTIDRDSRPARRAIVQFKRLKERFPNSKYNAKIDKMMAECTNNLAGHELYVAEFYYNSGKYKAALNRYKFLVENFPTSEHAAIALNKIGDTQKKVDKKEKKASK
ncbi:MAG: outer membrane protein assembly factor BamD [Desulfobacteraceae bacterium]|nr:outer membrane protein assembly factor BamD [Desulfobacteraceae bacterium]